MKWVKLVTRNVSLAFHILIAGQKPYVQEIIDFDINCIWYNNMTGEVAYAEQEVVGFGEIITAQIRENPQFAQKIAGFCKKRSDDLVRVATAIHRIKTNQRSNTSLGRLLEKFVITFRRLIPFLLVPHSIERYCTDEIERWVSGRTEVMELFTSPFEYDHSQDFAALRLASYVKRYGWNERAKKQLSAHAERHRGLSMWSITDAPLSNDHFRQEIENLIVKYADPLGEIRRITHQDKRRQHRVKAALVRMEANSHERAVVRLFQSYIALRTYRKNAICVSHYLHMPLVYEIARRMRLSRKEICYVTYEEMLDFLTYGKRVSAIIIHKRMKGWAALSWKGKEYIFSGPREVAKAMRTYGISFGARGSASDQLVGRVACRGEVTGVVKIVRKIEELDKVKTGDVLVAVMTTPDYTPAFHRCSAIVTDEGGVTCHAAIVSREYGIPCIIGTKVATQVLHDGEVIHVDALHGVITKVR